MREITFEAIRNVAAPAEGHPVWVITYRDNFRLVVKGEFALNRTAGETKKSIVFGAGLMKKASPAVQAKILTAAELGALRALTTWRDAGQGAQIAPKTKSDMLEMMNSNAPKFVFVKMPFVEDLTDLGNKLRRNKGLKLLACMRNSAGPLTQLGRIAAVDLFIGNADRLNVEDDDELGRVVNVGNLMFQKGQDANNNRTYTGVGLDWYEAGRAFSNLVAAPPVNWPGRILNDNNKLYRFAANLVDDLNTRFNNGLAGRITQLDLITQAGIERAYRGLIEGRQRIRTDLVGKVNEGQAVPSGVKARLEALGWLQSGPKPAAGGWNFKPTAQSLQTQPT